jgi:hypothetical protein
MNGTAADRRCPGQGAISVREAFTKEAPRLPPLPDNPCPLIEQIAVKVGTPNIRFDLNDYSITHPRAAMADGARRSASPTPGRSLPVKPSSSTCNALKSAISRQPSNPAGGACRRHR